MATSGTVNTTTIDIISIITHAARRARMKQHTLTPERLHYIQQNLSILLDELITKGMQLWVIEKILVPMYAGTAQYTLSNGEQDVINMFRRTPTRLAPTWTSSAGGTTTFLDDGDFTTVFLQTAPAGNLVAQFTDSTIVRNIGILPSGTTPGVSFTFQVSPDGVGWTTVLSITDDLTDNQWKWYDIFAGQSQPFFRIVAGTGYTLSFREFFLGSTSRDITITRMNIDDYGSLPDKFLAGTPTNFWLDRRFDKLQFYLWPVPTAVYDSSFVWLRRLVQDVGTVFTNEIEVPKRWLQAIIDSLAYWLGREESTTPVELIPLLKNQMDESMNFAEGEEVDRGPIKITPIIRGYTR